METKMAKCYLKLDKRRALKDGSYPIKIAVGYGTKVLISTGVSVALDEWNEKAQLCIGKNAKSINSELSTALARATIRILELREDRRFQKMTSKQISKALTADDIEEAFIEERPDFYQIAERFIRTRDADNTKSLYKVSVAKVFSFAGPGLNIEDMTREWLFGFSESMEGNKINSRAIHLRNVRAICNFAIDEGLTSFYPFRKFHIKTEETRKRALTIEQLRAVKDCEVTEIQREYRDMFLLMFYLIGINAADLFTAKKEDIVNGRFEYRRDKTGRLYSIKLEPEAIEIIERYQGKNWLLSPLDRYKSYRDYLHHLNDSLKTLGLIYRTSSKKSGAVICPDLSTYWTRHTWATMAAELDIPDPTISLSLGHAIAGHKTTAIYIKRDAAKVDAANRKVIDYLFGRVEPPVY